MEMLRRASFVATPPGTPKADPPKLRRKLQKISKEMRNQSTKQVDSSSSKESLDTRSGSKPAAAKTTQRPALLTPPDTPTKQQARSPKAKPAQQPYLPSPDLSDTKWLDYLRRSGIIYALDGTPDAPAPHGIPVSVIPELAHLKDSPAKSRPSVEAPPVLPMSLRNASTTSVIRRRAKTPVRHIGQLEGFTLLTEQPPPLPAIATPEAVSRSAGPTSSVEALAEQYRALLKQPSADSMADLAAPKHPRTHHRDHDDVVKIRPNSVEELHVLASQGRSMSSGSTDSDSTMVAFDDETVYFKPVSFSPEPPSITPIQQGDISPALPSDWSPPDNISLQICLDLLTKELSFAGADRTRRLGSDVSALQIWVMIESYERLRDRVLGADGLRLMDSQRACVEMMLDTWLRSLYAMHDSLAGEAGSISSDSDYGHLESPGSD